jgi:phospholipase/carboxylesterase
MKTANLPLLHKARAPRHQPTGPHPVLLLLHGRGADEEDLFGLSEYLDERLFVVSVRAPFPFGPGGGYTWYDLLEIGRPEPKMFAASYAKLTGFITAMLSAYPVDPRRLYLCGFSMGTMMSYAVALTRPDAVRGVMANSGYIPEETDLTFDWASAKGKPFFVAHGKFDPVIPVSFGQRARELLSKAGAALTYREYEMGHQIVEESLNDMASWLTVQLGQANVSRGPGGGGIAA